MQQYQLTKNRSKKQSLKKILFGSVVFVGLSVGTTQNSYAFLGIGPTIVIDPTEIAQTAQSIVIETIRKVMQAAQWAMQKLQYALQQVQHAMQKLQYELQLKQFATQMKQLFTQYQNLLADIAFIWTRAHDIYNTVNQLDNVHSIYQLVYGSTEALMNNIQSTVDFENDPCTAFKPAFGEWISSSPSASYTCVYPDPNKGIKTIYKLKHIASQPVSGGIQVSDVRPPSLFALPQNPPSLLYNITSNADLGTNIDNANIDAAALNTLQEEAKDSAALTKLNTSEIQFNLQQQSDLQNEAENIDNIQNLQTTGNLQALQKQNQLAGNIATQLMKIHALILARNSAEAQKREEETQEKAKAETFYYQVFLTDSYAPMKKHVWK